MLGEIRDSETADVAIQASMTGHLVLSTIHTNDAAGSIPRLMEMGVRGFMMADALSAIIGQRLVRKICPHCMEEAVPDEMQKQKVAEAIAKMSPENKQRLPQVLRFYTSRGCSECNNLGYKGRVGVYEIMTMTDGLRTLISAKYPSIVEVRNTAQSEGMLTMFQDGLFKALNKETDLKELISNVDT
jgi:general secretion pathway protein E